MQLKKKTWWRRNTKSSQRTLNIYSTPSSLSPGVAHFPSIHFTHSTNTVDLALVFFFSVLFICLLLRLFGLAFLYCVIFFAHKAWPQESRRQEKKREREMLTPPTSVPSFSSPPSRPPSFLSFSSLRHACVRLAM